MAAPRIIDCHAHMLEPALLDICAAHSVQTGFGARPFPAPDDPSGKGKVYARMADPAAHLADMDRRGVDAAVISLSTVLQNFWWAAPDQDAAMNRRVNDVIADWVARHPSRFIGSFTLPLQDIDRALEELERAVRQLSLPVANLPAQIGGAYLGDPRFAPLWQALAELQVVAFVHPHGIADRWFQDYRMWNSIGQSIEEVKVMTSLIYEGVLDRHPDLVLVMAHGGGYFPHYMGRLDRNVHNYPDSARNIRGKPSDYLGRFYYDTCVYDPAVIDGLVQRVGAGRLIMGSDWPVGETDPVGFLRRCHSLDASAIDAVAGGTLDRLLDAVAVGRRGALAAGRRDDHTR